MIVLVINSGSSSLKYQVFDMQKEALLAKGLVERIGLNGSILTHRPTGKDQVVIETEIPNHDRAIQLTVEALTHEDHGVVSSLSEINAVGHRVVHGGDRFSDSVVINEKSLAEICALFEVAPLHNPPAVMGIEACSHMLPGVSQAAVFDTAFHQTLPNYAYNYALPYELAQKYSLRRYGFHGTSHKYVAERAATMAGRPLEDLKIITCHLGNGASITAVDGGRSVDTSMGFTPLEGLIMGTRVGDMDPAAVPFLMEKEGLTTGQLNDLLNKKSGVLGVSGVSSDFRDLEEGAAKGDERCRLALDMFAYRVKKYIGAYAAVMNGVDVIVFTAGLGENSASMRRSICGGLGYLGVQLDEEKNKGRGEADVSAAGATCRVMVVPTDEELMIARDTYRLLK
ncbi:acetate/propionate family kinase [Heliobacterium gestii]|uniref:Acetate kinase n=1 Tax=Heliomicrobium gestii TaxID=2699 RepID=A0A845LDC4_HELGE|nr:acetate kinase [Heliomicrobium gestii]MBM7867034.1 acetate kinase [Heliomicrobium gestii]MZP43551.1 acetate/propionate family kinase [Heliomicrobium gestii]